jgi:integrase
MQAKLLADMVRVLTRQVPPTRETTIFDTVLSRFALRVRPPVASGRPWASMFFVRYVGPDGRERKIKIGSPATMDLDAARKAAKDTLATVDKGGDPAAAKAELREQWSIGQAVDAYLDSAEFHRKTAKVQSCDAATLRLHVAHRLRHLPLAKLDVPTARQLLRAIESDDRTNARHRRMGGAGAARKAARVFSSMLSWCVHEGRLARNPLIGALRLDGDRTRETVLTTTTEYSRLFAAMDELVASGQLRPVARAFIATAALTGMRRGELQGLHWRDVSLAERRITLTMSKGAKLARGGVKTEAISLPPFAAAVLAEIRPDDADEDEPVFPSRRGHIEVNRDWQRVREAAELPADLTLHGLRHSVGTVAVMSGLSGPEVQKLLRHRNISTTAKYIHLADSLRLQDRAMNGMAPELKERTGTG